MSSLCIITNPDAFRANVSKKINEKLDNDIFSRNLEKGIYNYSLKEASQRKIVKKWDNKLFVQIYTSHLKSILINLTDKWIAEITNGNLLSHKFAFMNHQEFNHDKWAALIDLKSKRDKNKFEVNIASATDTFTCRKCKGNQTTYYLQQTRSADESTTIFVQCITCGSRWKTS
jgi:DNA-directed RNA polymerase subunit M/transcription elongation factor TFIIS